MTTSRPEETILKKIYDRLYEEKKVESQVDFAEKTKYHPTPVSLMITGKKPLPFKFLITLYKVFNVNINYIVSKGSGNMFLNETEMISHKELKEARALKDRTEMLEKENENLKQRLADKDKIISLLEKHK